MTTIMARRKSLTKTHILQLTDHEWDRVNRLVSNTLRRTGKFYSRNQALRDLVNEALNLHSIPEDDSQVDESR